MPTFRVVSDGEARDLLKRPQDELFVEELKKHKTGDWVVAELAETEKKETVKIALKRAADRIGFRISLQRSPKDKIIFQIDQADGAA